MILNEKLSKNRDIMFNKIININIFLFILSTILTLLLMEVLVRTFSPESNIWNFQIPLEREGFRMIGIPNLKMEHKSLGNEFNINLEFNKIGFRDHNNLKESSKEDYVILGDSYAFGYGVEEEDRFGEVLEKTLLDSLECFNLGIPSCHFLNSKSNLEYGLQLGLQTENMIFAVCMENDILKYEDIQEPTVSILKNIKSWGHKNSCLYNFAGKQIHSSKFIEDTLNQLGLVNKLEEKKILAEINQSVISSATYLEDLINEFNTIILIIPSRFLWMEEHKENANLQHQKFIEILMERSMNVIDMKPVFDSLSTNPLDDFYFKIDGHWKEEGHKVAAQAIYDRLQIK